MRKGVIDLFADLIGGMIILAFIIAVLAGMKFWNAKQTLDGTLAAERIANDMAFMQASSAALKRYTIPSYMTIAVTGTEVTAESSLCLPTLFDQCGVARQMHHVDEAKVTRTTIEAFTGIDLIRSRSRVVCLYKQTETSPLRLCAGEDCCSVS